MAYSYSRGYYEDTNSKEVATAVLEAYADGVTFETLIKKNKTARQYWYQIQSEKAKAEQSREREKTRLAKLAEKQAAEKAQREEVMTKLSREELEAFGLVRKGKR
jgi:predicted ATPase